jgi:hypothetical protein
LHLGSAQSGGCGHNPPQVCFEKWLSNDREAVTLMFASREQEDLQIGLHLLCAKGQLAAVKAGHIHIGDDVRLLADALKSVLWSGGRLNIASKVCEHGCHDIEDQGFIIYYKYFAGHRTSIRALHAV